MTTKEKEKLYTSLDKPQIDEVVAKVEKEVVNPSSSLEQHGGKPSLKFGFVFNSIFSR